MPKRSLKSAERMTVAEHLLEGEAPRRSVPSARTLRQVAVEAARVQPPAIGRPKRHTIVMTLKIGVETADALAERAERDGMTQKQLICTALAAFKVRVDPLDLEDRTRRRVRGIAA